MGCGCGKNKNKNQKSSRMPVEPPKKIGNISVPMNMTPNQRRSTIAKINNDNKPIAKKKGMSVADRMMLDRIRKRDYDG